MKPNIKQVAGQFDFEWWIRLRQYSSSKLLAKLAFWQMSNVSTQNWPWVKEILFLVKIFIKFWKQPRFWEKLTLSQPTSTLTIWVLKALYYKTRSKVETWDCTICCLTLTGPALDMSFQHGTVINLLWQIIQSNTAENFTTIYHYTILEC